MTVLPELRRLLDVSTAAPWYAVKGPDWDEDDGGYLGWMVMQSPEQEVCDTGRFRERAREDAELIVALRNHADALLDVVEAVDATHVTDTDHDDWYAVKGDDWDAVQAALARLDGKETP